MKYSVFFLKKFNITMGMLFLFFLIPILLIGNLILDANNIHANESVINKGLTFPFFFQKATTSREFSPKTVFVKDRNSTTTYLVYSRYAKDILAEIGLSINEYDDVWPSINEDIPNDGVIVIVKVNTVQYIKLRSVTFKIREIEDETKNRGNNKIIVQGKTGVIADTYEEIYKDETLFKKEIIDSEIIIPMITQVVKVGTKPVTIHNCTYWNRVVEDEVPKKKFPEKNAWMKYIMYCETGCNSGQVTSGKYFGLYQFSKSTYRAYGGTNIFDGYEQIEIVSKMYDLQGNPAHHWPACNRAFERDYNK